MDSDERRPDMQGKYAMAGVDGTGPTLCVFITDQSTPAHPVGARFRIALEVGQCMQDRAVEIPASRKIR